MPAAIVVGFLVAAAACTTTSATQPSPSTPSSTKAPEPSPASDIDPALGIDNIDHVIFIVQENRSFDEYFGTFPGADGLPRDAEGHFTTCVPDPEAGRCFHPYHDKDLFDEGGPHGVVASRIDVNGGKMDGFISSLEAVGNGCFKHPEEFACKRAHPGPNGEPDIMGFHTGREIANYWAYANRYLLQDRMFAPSDSWTLPSHLYLVSGWSATCPDLDDPMSCHSDLDWPGSNAAGRRPIWTPADGEPRPYIWGDITWLFHEHHVSWAYYVGTGTCVVAPCTPRAGTLTAPIQNPLAGFKTVEVDRQLSNIQSNKNYFTSAADGTLPDVSWVMPTEDLSEHPPDNIADGQAWVTKVINAAMQGPDWLHTAIFVTWDDWGGFYDHVKPIRVDRNGYGIRVPGIMISPFAKGGVDHQTLSFDAYLKFLEDRFMGGARIDPATDGWPDSRPTVREDVKQLGDLAREFDFSQEPIPTLILKPYPPGIPGPIHTDAMHWSNG